MVSSALTSYDHEFILYYHLSSNSTGFKTSKTHSFPCEGSSLCDGSCLLYLFHFGDLNTVFSTSQPKSHLRKSRFCYTLNRQVFSPPQLHIYILCQLIAYLQVQFSGRFCSSQRKLLVLLETLLQHHLQWLQRLSSICSSVQKPEITQQVQITLISQTKSNTLGHS